MTRLENKGVQLYHNNNEVTEFLREKLTSGAKFMFTGESEQAILTAIQASLEYLPNEKIILIYEQSLQLEINGQHPIFNIRRLTGERDVISGRNSSFDINIIPDIQTEGHVLPFVMYAFMGKQVIGGHRSNSPLDALQTLSILYQKSHPDLSIETVRQMMTLPIQFIVHIEKETRRLDHTLKIYELLLEENKDVIVHQLFQKHEQVIPLLDRSIQIEEMV
ncbi:hypothetical protein ACFYU8_18625 [Brevibacillus sp. NPDC003359]|uniref:hypothetical protein n=1 Tax=unclassified Brevibacillus TaxID=2684853 RepID=UPI003675D63A